MYSAEIIVNGVKGYVGGSDATDLAIGVEACAEAIEQVTGGQGVVDEDDYCCCGDGCCGSTLDPYTQCLLCDL